jgi:hypothetical protein
MSQWDPVMRLTALDSASCLSCVIVDIYSLIRLIHLVASAATTPSGIVQSPWTLGHRLFELLQFSPR